MANTFRLNWFRKLLNSCSHTKYRHIDDCHPIASSSDIKDLGSPRKVPRLPEQTHSTVTRSPKYRKCATVAVVKMHPVVRNLNNSNKQKRGLALGCQKRRRDEQLTKTLGSHAASVHAKPIPIKLFAMHKQEPTPSHHRFGWQDERDSMAIRNIEKLVRESQLRLQDRQSKNQPVGSTRKSSQKTSGGPGKSTKKDKAAKGPTKKPLGLEYITSLEKPGDKDVKLARMLTNNPESNAKPSGSSRSSCGNLQTRHVYRMRVAHLRAKDFMNLRKRSKDIKRIQAPSLKNPDPAGCKLLKEEQKRLDTLKAEWLQLKGLENAAKLKHSEQTKELNKPKDTVHDMDLSSLIVDPKSFLTQVHVKRNILSVDLEDNVSDESPDGFPDTPTESRFGESDDGVLVPH